MGRVLGVESITRRRLLSSVMFPVLANRVRAVFGESVSQPNPVNLGHGLRILDYRLFPTTDATRFIAELHNESDQILDIPTVSLVLPHLDENHNFAWASSPSSVIHPGDSELLVGVAPFDLTSDNDWGEPKWSVCGELSTALASLLDGGVFDLRTKVEIKSPTLATIRQEFFGYSHPLYPWLMLKAIVRDTDLRICGSMNSIQLKAIQLGDYQVRESDLYPELPIITNPFNLIDTVAGITVYSSIQPSRTALPQSCLHVMS